jgi:hypothetical protein
VRSPRNINNSVIRLSSLKSNNKSSSGISLVALLILVALPYTVDALTSPAQLRPHQISRSLIFHHGLPRDRYWIRCQGSQAVRYPSPDRRTAIDTGNRWQSFHKEEFKLKTFEEDDVDIAIDACGVCGSDVHCKIWKIWAEQLIADTNSYHWRLG